MMLPTLSLKRARTDFPLGFPDFLEGVYPPSEAFEGFLPPEDLEKYLNNVLNYRPIHKRTSNIYY